MKKSFLIYAALSLVPLFIDCASMRKYNSGKSIKFPPTQKVDLLLEKPQKPHILLQTIESRGDLRSSLPDLFVNMKKKGMEIGADALIPTNESKNNSTEKPAFESYIVRYQNIDGGKVPVLRGYAIKYNSSIQKLKNEGYEFEYDSKQYHFGIQSDIVPYILKGYQFGLWFGKTDYRLKAGMHSLNIPEFFLSYDYENGKIESAYSLYFDYFFKKKFSGYYLSSGIEMWKGSLGHPEETQIGEYQTFIFSFGIGYTKNIFSNFTLGTKIMGQFIMLGDSEVNIGNHTAKFYRGTPYVSLELGWQY